jgi:hypothetical protein
MRSNLTEIFLFLEQNRNFNLKLQQKYFKRNVLSEIDTESKILALLYEFAYSQSKPNIDKITEFFKFVKDQPHHLNSFESFVKRIYPKNSKPRYKNLFCGMVDQPGWGVKTAALFTKSIYQLHNGSLSKELKIWNDIPQLTEEDKLYLPVDSVITCVFIKLNFPEPVSFKSINKFLHDNYSNKEIEIWDDLWFWGFITQKGSGINRIHTWNESKYWILRDSDKNPETINTIMIKAQEFIDIINNGCLHKPIWL